MPRDLTPQGATADLPPVQSPGAFSRPSDGGSYARQPDGSLVLLTPTTSDRAPPAPATPDPTPGPAPKASRRRGRKE